MEIFLLLIVLTLILVFQSNNKTKIEAISKKLQDLDKTLKELQVQEKISTFTKIEERQKTSEEIPEIKKVEIKPPIIEPKREEPPAIVVSNVEEIHPEKPEVIDLHNELFKQQPALSEKKPAPVREPQPSWWEKFKTINPDLEKFIGENLISKIGVAILVLGIGFFVKYAIDQNWINETARTGIGILCGGIVMGFAHKLRKNFKPFSSVLVSGAVAIFYFTIAIAFHEYHLFSQTVAFSIMLFITAFSIFISISYNRIELAALSLIGGFAAPFMVSTGEGNYVVLFTYIMILDTGMLVLAYMRKWNLINILAYVFTIILYGAWLSTKVVGVPNAPYKGALLFGGAFYLSFVLMNVINNIKERRIFSAIELSILLSNTFLFYGAGMSIFQFYHPELKGAFTISLAAFNFVCSWLLQKRFKADRKLVYLMIGLTLTFVTLAAPVQLKGNYITLFWGAEAVLLIWLAQRTKTIVFKFASILIHALMLFSLFMDWSQVYNIGMDAHSPTILLNKGFITGFTSVLSLLAAMFLFRKEPENISYLNIELNQRKYSDLLKIGAVIISYFTGFFELQYQTHQYFASDAASNTIIGFYHLAFCGFLGYFLVKTNKPLNIMVATVLFSINIMLFVFMISIYPFTELRERIELTYDSKTGFLFHYFSLACIIYSCVLLQKISKMQSSFLSTIKRPFIWMFSLFILYIASSELLLNGLYIIAEPLQAKTPDFYLEAYNEWNDNIIKIVKIGFPIIWSLIAFSFLAVGISKQSKDLRVTSLVLLAITIAKLFIYDIKNVSEAGKIIAFIILGVVLLVMSFMYQKIKAIILQDEQTNKKENSGEQNS